MFGIVILRQSVDRFRAVLRLAGVLNKHGARSYNLFCFSVTLTGASPNSVSFI